MEKNIYIIRHCKAEGQAPEAALTEIGLQQALKLAQFLSGKKIERVISSPFKRAVQTVTPYINQENKQLVIDDRLTERVLSTTYFHDWLEKLEETYVNLDLKYEGGESSREAMARILNVIDDIINSEFNNVAIVTHGGIMSLLLHHYDSSFGFAGWRNISNPDVYLLKITESGAQFQRVWSDKKYKY